MIEPERFLLLLKPECGALAAHLLACGHPTPHLTALQTYQKQFGVFQEGDYSSQELSKKLNSYFPDQEIYIPSIQVIAQLAHKLSQRNLPQLSILTYNYYLLGGTMPVVCRRDLIQRVGDLLSKKQHSTSTAVSQFREPLFQKQTLTSSMAATLSQQLNKLLFFSEPIQVNSEREEMRTHAGVTYSHVVYNYTSYLLVQHKFQSLYQLTYFVQNLALIAQLNSPLVAPIYHHDLSALQENRLSLLYKARRSFISGNSWLPNFSEEMMQVFVLQLECLIEDLHQMRIYNLRFRQEDFVFVDGNLQFLYIKICSSNYLHYLDKQCALEAAFASQRAVRLEAVVENDRRQLERVKAWLFKRLESEQYL